LDDDVCKILVFGGVEDGVKGPISLWPSSLGRALGFLGMRRNSVTKMSKTWARSSKSV